MLFFSNNHPGDGTNSHWEVVMSFGNGVQPPGSLRLRHLTRTYQTHATSAATGWWLTYPSEKWWTSSIGMIINYSQYMETYKMFQTTNQAKKGNSESQHFAARSLFEKRAFCENWRNKAEQIRQSKNAQKKVMIGCSPALAVKIVLLGSLIVL